MRNRFMCRTWPSPDRARTTSCSSPRNTTRVYAFDADSAGAGGGLLWKTNLGVSAVTVTATFTNKDFGTRYNGNAYTDIEPEVGITGTPVIDTNSGTLYVDAFTGEPGGGVTNYFHRLHALNISRRHRAEFQPGAGHGFGGRNRAWTVPAAG